MVAILWICFETPSVRDSKKIEKIINNTPLKLYQAGVDYLKLIKDRNNELIWIYNKINKEILFTSNIDEEKKEKILELIR